jgi:hypothetical protein
MWRRRKNKDRPRAERGLPHGEEKCILELKAFRIAAETTQDLVSKEIRVETCEEVDHEIEGLSDMPEQPESLDDAVDLISEYNNEQRR